MPDTAERPDEADAVSPEDDLQQRLADFDRRRLGPGLPGRGLGWREDFAQDGEFLFLEGEYLERERAAVQAHAASAPTDPDGFDSWLTGLTAIGPGQGDPLFPWLADICSMDDMRWFLAQEVAGEAGFEDLTALTQVKMPVGPKLELARNYWDEMGRGNEKGMHGPLLETAGPPPRARASRRDHGVGIARARERHGRPRLEPTLRLSLDRARSASSSRRRRTAPPRLGVA